MNGAGFKTFRQQAIIALEDIHLQTALERGAGGLGSKRDAALAALPAADELRDHFKQIRAATLARLGEHLETFERNATAAGARVHWARTGAEATEIVLGIARANNVTLVTKSKSMATEEIRLNEALEANGIRPVETDLGEYIIQLAGEAPSHIIAPAIHKRREEVAVLLRAQSGETIADDDVPHMTAVARRLLRQEFLASGMGISGGNMMIAETGSIVLVENEGNARLVSSAPPIHVAVIGIEKLARTWDDAAVWLSLLARSATGQPLSIYTSLITGTARDGDADGPREVHIVLLDNGRSDLVGTEYEEVLQCIRCGACLNVCPVYRQTGGHAYGSPYSGPIGAVVSPLLFGLEAYAALPHASSLCGACRDVCPARIDLPRMLLALRNDEVDQGVLPWTERQAERLLAAMFGTPQRLRRASGLGRLLQGPLARDGAVRLPGGLHPTGERDLPALAPKSFRDIWRDGEVDA